MRVSRIVVTLFIAATSLWGKDLVAFEGFLEWSLFDEDGIKDYMTHDVKGAKTRTAFASTCEGSEESIYELTNHETGDSYILGDTRKIYLSMVYFTDSDLRLMRKDLPSVQDERVKKTKKTKEILGYECRKYVVTGEDGKLEVWATDELGVFPKFLFGDTGMRFIESVEDEKLFPLEIIKRSGWREIVREIRVTKLEHESISDDQFTLPAGYEPAYMSPEEFREELSRHCEEKTKSVKKMGKETREPVAVQRARAIYPTHLRARGVAGEVVAEFFVEKDGTVSYVQIVSSPHRDLSESVVEAFEKWLFEPGLVDGEPRRVKMRVTFSF